MSIADRRFLVLVAASAGLLAAPPGALAEERDCVGAIGAETVDNVRVPEGAACTMNGTFVKGTVKVERGATLEAQAVRVVGNVQGEGAADAAPARARAQAGGLVLEGGQRRRQGDGGPVSGMALLRSIN